LGLPDEKASALNGNHLEIAKFSSKDDDNYNRVAAHIVKIVKVETEKKEIGAMYVPQKDTLNIRSLSKWNLDDKNRADECNNPNLSFFLS
jgi:hypothetical protein